MGPWLNVIATATADISDGLLADAGHIASASNLRVHIERDAVPLSAAAGRAVAADPHLWANVLGGGDDYELVFAVPQRRRGALMAVARAAGIAVTTVGRLETGGGGRVTAGRPPPSMAPPGVLPFLPFLRRHPPPRHLSVP